ncbi:uncharacterized protein LOC120347211 [Styela clava]
MADNETTYAQVNKTAKSPTKKSSEASLVNEGGMKKNFRRIDLIATVQQLVKNSKYNRALELINELLTQQTEGWDRLHTLLMKIECEIQSGRRGIKNDIELVTESMLILRPTTSDVMDIAQDYATSKNEMRSIALYMAGIELCKINLSGDAAVRGIKSCIKHITGIVNSAAKADPSILIVIKESIIPLLLDGVKTMDQIHGVSPNAITEQKARCMFNAGICYRVVGDDELALKSHENAVQLMQLEFKDEAVHYQVYGRSIAGMGHSHRNLKKVEKAKELYQTALIALNHATDWTSEEQKDKETSILEKLLN